MSDIDEESRDMGVLVALGVDAGLTYQGQPKLGTSFQGSVDAETLVKVIELLEKGRVA